jgi:hypothetical protein
LKARKALVIGGKVLYHRYTRSIFYIRRGQAGVEELLDIALAGEHESGGSEGLF